MEERDPKSTEFSRDDQAALGISELLRALYPDSLLAQYLKRYIDTHVAPGGPCPPFLRDLGLATCKVSTSARNEAQAAEMPAIKITKRTTEVLPDFDIEPRPRAKESPSQLQDFDLGPITRIPKAPEE